MGVEVVLGGEAQTGGFCSDQSSKTYFADSGSNNHKKRQRLTEDFRPSIEIMRKSDGSTLEDVPSSCGSKSPVCKHTSSGKVTKTGSHCGVCNFDIGGNSGTGPECFAVVNP